MSTSLLFSLFVCSVLSQEVAKVTNTGFQVPSDQRQLVSESNSIPNLSARVTAIITKNSIGGVEKLFVNGIEAPLHSYGGIALKKGDFKIVSVIGGDPSKPLGTFTMTLLKGVHRTYVDGVEVPVESVIGWDWMKVGALFEINGTIIEPYLAMDPFRQERKEVPEITSRSTNIITKCIVDGVEKLFSDGNLLPPSSQYNKWDLQLKVAEIKLTGGVDIPFIRYPPDIKIGIVTAIVTKNLIGGVEKLFINGIEAPLFRYSGIQMQPGDFKIFGVIGDRRKPVAAFTKTILSGVDRTYIDGVQVPSESVLGWGFMKAGGEFAINETTSNPYLGVNPFFFTLANKVVPKPTSRATSILTKCIVDGVEKLFEKGIETPLSSELSLQLKVGDFSIRALVDIPIPRLPTSTTGFVDGAERTFYEGFAVPPPPSIDYTGFYNGAFNNFGGFDNSRVNNNNNNNRGRFVPLGNPGLFTVSDLAVDPINGVEVGLSSSTTTTSSSSSNIPAYAIALYVIGTLIVIALVVVLVQLFKIKSQF